MNQVWIFPWNQPVLDNEGKSIMPKERKGTMMGDQTHSWQTSPTLSNLIQVGIPSVNIPCKHLHCCIKSKLSVQETFMSKEHQYKPDCYLSIWMKLCMKYQITMFSKVSHNDHLSKMTSSKVTLCGVGFDRLYNYNH